MGFQSIKTKGTTGIARSTFFDGCFFRSMSELKWLVWASLLFVSHHIGFDWYNFLALEFFRNGIRPNWRSYLTI